MVNTNKKTDDLSLFLLFFPLSFLLSFSCDIKNIKCEEYECLNDFEDITFSVRYTTALLHCY